MSSKESTHLISLVVNHISISFVALTHHQRAQRFDSVKGIVSEMFPDSQIRAALERSNWNEQQAIDILFNEGSQSQAIPVGPSP
jgi:hypothetical protein